MIEGRHKAQAAVTEPAETKPWVVYRWNEVLTLGGPLRIPPISECEVVASFSTEEEAINHAVRSCALALSTRNYMRAQAGGSSYWPYFDARDFYNPRDVPDNVRHAIGGESYYLRNWTSPVRRTASQARRLRTTHLVPG